MKAKEIQELVRIVEKSSVDEIEITKWWGHKITIRKNVAAQMPQAVEYVIPQAPAAQAPNAPGAVAPVPEEVKPAEPTNNYVEIKAPMVGTFYRSASPDADPYVKEGDSVSSGQALCIIEAMKLMNEIEAEVSGRVVKVLVDNAQPIEYNQSLFLIDPS
jgi:acetyl-CoA carboxylase biotin carboxyl carrier protein